MASSTSSAIGVPPVVAVSQGELEGFTEDGIHKFYGIPYAAPPTGELRWAPPQPAAAWDGVRPATAFGNVAPQAVHIGNELGAGTTESEDCLYLNVWTQTLDPKARQPVILWVHGGGNLYGSGSEPQYDGTALALRGVTLVTFNYRLGVFGFLAHPSFGANHAVLDHVAALRWVQENIVALGGDPGNVTIAGQSAGAVAVRALLASPPAAGLFHRAIIQSAGFEAKATGEWWSRETNETAANELFGLLGSSDPATLRALPADRVLAASLALSGAQDRPGMIRTPAQLVWQQVVDGEIVVADEEATWNIDVPVMLGTVEHESRYFLRPERAYDRPLLERMSASLAGPAAAEAIAWFDATGLPPYEALDALVTTTVFTEPASETLAHFARLGRIFYFYHFTRCSPGAIAGRTLAAHAVELPYLFSALPDESRYDATDRALAEALQEVWTAFARGGVPAGGMSAPWPRFDLADPMMTVIGDAIHAEPFAITPLVRIVKEARASGPRRCWLGSPT